MMQASASRCVSSHSSKAKMLARSITGATSAEFARPHRKRRQRRKCARNLWAATKRQNNAARIRRVGGTRSPNVFCLRHTCTRARPSKRRMAAKAAVASAKLRANSSREDAMAANANETRNTATQGGLDTCSCDGASPHTSLRKGASPHFSPSRRVTSTTSKPKDCLA